MPGPWDCWDSGSPASMFTGAPDQLRYPSLMHGVRRGHAGECGYAGGSSWAIISSLLRAAEHADSQNRPREVPDSSSEPDSGLVKGCSQPSMEERRLGTSVM